MFGIDLAVSIMLCSKSGTPVAPRLFFAQTAVRTLPCSLHL
jgi:hypothetical protein